MNSDISRILDSGESETTEFKGPRTSLESLGRVACGMLNQQGGVLLWGTDDKGAPIGIQDADRCATELNAFLVQHLNPRPLLSVSVHTLQDKPIIAVDIPRGADKPYSLNRQIWVRVGARTLRADDEASSELVERSAAQLDRWEREPMPGFGFDDCDAREIAEARSEIANTERFGMDMPTNDVELFRRLSLERSGQLTNASVVLFAREPRVWAPNLSVRVVSYSSEKSDVIANDLTVEGPAVHALKEVVGLLQQRTGFSGRFETKRMERQDRPAYALFALREALVNATVHRDYGVIGGDVRVEVFPKYLTIRNAGKLPEGWTTDDLRKKHGSHPVNPDIARVFFLRGMMEQLGMGTQKLIAACKSLGAKPPVWSDKQGSVTVTLFRAPEPDEGQELPSRQARFLKSKDSGAEFKVGDYASETEVSERQARRELAKLEELGLIDRQGKGPATYYRRTARSLG